MKKLFQNKSFNLLFAGSLVSSIGTTLFSFAAALYVQSLFPKAEYGNTGAFYFSLVASSGILVRVLISPFAGTLVDKWNKVKVIYMTDYIRGFLFFGTLFLMGMGLSNYETMYLFIAVSVIAGINQSFFSPAVGSALPEIVGEDMLQPANGIQSIVGSIQGIFGVIAGMFLYELVGIEVAILLNAISFVFSGVSEMFIKTKYIRPSEIEEDENSSFLSNLRFGFNYLKSKEGLFQMMMFSLLLNLAFSPLFSIGIPFLFETELGVSAFYLGGTDLAFSIVMLVASFLVGAMTIPSVNRAVKMGLIGMTFAFSLSAVFVVLITYEIIPFTFFYVGYILSMMILAGTMILTNVPLNTSMMKTIDPKVRGRVFGIISSLSAGAIPISMIIGGKIIEFSNVATLSIVCTIIILFPTFGFLTSKKVNRLLDSMDQREVIEYKVDEEVDIKIGELAKQS